MTSRPDWGAYGLSIARAVSVRGDCTRRQVGAVILDVSHRLAGAGYNGSYPGGPSCLAGDCPRGRHYQVPEADSNRCCPNDHCACGHLWPCPEEEGARHYRHTASDWGPLKVGEVRPAYCNCGHLWPCPDAVAPGSSYDTGPGACIASHAEANALADVDNRSRLEGATMYVTTEPCDGCVRHIRNTTRIAAIRWPEGMVALP